MNKNIFLVLLLLLFGTSLLAQQRYKRFTYFGIDLGTKTSFFKVEDSGSELYSHRNFQNPMQGIFVEQEFNYLVSASTGLYFTRQTLDLRFRRDGAYNPFDPIRLVQIPLHLRFNIPLTYGTPEVRIVPIVGGSFLFNQSNNEIPIKGKILPDFADSYSGAFRRDLNRAFYFLEGGVNIDMMFAKGLILSFGGMYSKGLNRMIQADVNYIINKNSYRGTIHTNGDNINLRVAIKYPVSRFWRKGFQTKPKKDNKKK